MKLTDRVTSSDGTTIAFEQVGEGPPLVLVDPAAGFRGFGPMGELADALAPRFSVFRYDRRGRGESTDTLPYAVEREVEDLQAVIEAAGGSAFVHGFSSGAVLAMHAAAQGLPMPKLTLLEPPLSFDEPRSEAPDPLEREVAELVAAGRRGDAVEHFNRAIGVPDEYLVGMREAPYWPALEALAHTLVYDCIIPRTMTVPTMRSIRTPTLVVASEGTDERLLAWGRQLSETMPNATFHSLPGEWHGVPADVLARAMTQFLVG
jgi:pimeloyl-ACP methyl ester carboxylesterase